MEQKVYSVEDMAQEIGVVLDEASGRVLTNGLLYVAEASGDKPSTKRKRFKDRNGNHQSYKVSAFEYRYIRDFEKLCQGLRLI